MTWPKALGCCTLTAIDGRCASGWPRAAAYGSANTARMATSGARRTPPTGSAMRTRVAAIEVSRQRLRAEVSAHVEWPEPESGEALLECGAPLRETVAPLRMQRRPQQHGTPAAALGIPQLDQAEPRQSLKLAVAAQLVPDHYRDDV